MSSPIYVLMLALALQAQTPPGEVRGTILGDDEGGRRPLPHALVELTGPGETRSVLADSAGRYVISGVSAGLRRLRALHVGYDETRVEVLVPDGASVSVDLALAPRPVELAGVLVRSDGLALPEVAGREAHDGAGRARAEISLRALEATPGLAEAGLGDAARKLPGNEPSDPTDVLFMRGSTADLKLVLLDGAPVYTPFHLGGLIKSFDAAALGAATHHVGGAPARYDGGLSYILDLRTRSPDRDRFRTEGSVDLMSAGATVEGPLGERAGVLASSRALHGLESRLVGGGRSPYGYVDGLARGEVDLAPGHRISMTAFGNRESVHLSLSEAAAEAPAGVGSPATVPDDASWGNLALSIAYGGSWKTTDVDLGASVTRYRAELPIPLPRDTGQAATPRDPDAPPDALLASGETARLRLTADAKRSGADGALRFGVSLDRLRMDAGASRLSGPGAGGAEAYDLRATGSVLGGYLDGLRRLGPELDLRYGLRVDRFDPGGTRSAIRLALLWSVREDALLTIAAGRYHQLTRATDTDVELQMGDGSATGTGGIAPSLDEAPLLSVARSDHLVLSLDQRLTPAVRLAMEGFYKRFGDLSGVRQEDLNASGVDLRLLREGSRLTGWLGYSLSWFWEEPDALGRSDEFAGRHLLTAGLRGRAVGPWGVDVQVAYSDGLPLTSIPFARGALGQEDVSAPTTGMDGSARQEPAPSTDAFLRVDAEVFADFETVWGARTVRFRPYLRVLNALDRRDALFYYFEPWRDPALRPLAELSVVPVLGLEWRF